MGNPRRACRMGSHARVPPASDPPGFAFFEMSPARTPQWAIRWPPQSLAGRVHGLPLPALPGPQTAENPTSNCSPPKRGHEMVWATQIGHPPKISTALATPCAPLRPRRQRWGRWPVRSSNFSWVSRCSWVAAPGIGREANLKIELRTARIGGGGSSFPSCLHAFMVEDSHHEGNEGNEEGEGEEGEGSGLARSLVLGSACWRNA